MSVIHFKFKNSLDYDSITFDGLHLSLKDLKKCIIQKKRLKSEEVDLQVINAQTREEYKDNELLIPRNTSVVIARVPVNTGNTREPAVSRDKVWEAFRMTTQAAIEEHENVSHEKHHELDHGHPISEMDRIKEMMRQSTSDFDPSKYDKKYPTGPVSSTYVCFKCGQIGQHHIYLCPFRGDTTTQDNRMKRSTGIPQSFMIKVDDPNMPGAYKTNTGYAVPAIDAVAYAQGKKERPPFLPNETREEQEPAMPLPKDYMCLLCSNIMTDAVVIPCCGNNYCDECIRNALLETEEHICPTCGESEISPDRLISNRFLRTAISNFYNETGNIMKTTRVIAPPVIHAQHNGPGPQQPGVAPQAQTGPPVTQIPYMPSSRPTGAPFGANALPRLQMPPPSSQGPPPPQQLTPNTPTQDEVAPLVPQTTVTDEELAKGLTIKTTVGYRRPMRLDPQDLPKPRGPPPHSRSLPPRPPMRPPGPPPPRFPPPNMPPPGAMLSMPPRIIPPQVLPGPPPAVMLGPLPPVLLPPPPGPIPVFPPPPGPFPPPGVYAEKPLTREEFYRTKKMLKEAKEKKRDLIDDFAKELLGYKRDQTKRKSLSRSRSRSRSRSWSRSRSRSRPRFRSRSFSRSRSRSRTPLRRSITPRRSRSRTPRSRSQLSRSPLSRSPRARRVSRSSSISHSRSRRSFSRSRTRSRSFSPRRSRSRSRLRSLSRGRTPVRLRSKSLSRRRSLTPTRRRSWSRSLSRSRSRTPLKRSSRSRSFSPRGRSVKRFSRSRSRSPGRRSLKRFSRSLSNSPLQKRFSRSPVGKKFSKSPNRPQSPRSPSLGRPATSSSIKKLSRSPSVTKLSRSPNSKRFSKSPGKKDLPKSPERKKLSRSPDSKRISPSLSKKRISQSPGKKILSQSPSKKRLSRSPSKKILSRSPSKKRLSRSPSPRRSSKSPSRRRSKSPTRKRSPLPPRKRSLSPRPRRRSRSPPYHDNFRNDWPPYRSPRSPPQQGYPPGRYTQAQLSYGYMQPGDPYYRYDQQMENYHQYYQDYYQRYGFPPPPPPGTYNRVSQYHEVSHPGPYRPNSPPRGPRTRSPFRGRAPDNRNQDKPRPERRNTDRSSERPKGDNNKKSTNKPQKAMKPGIRKEAKNETDSNKVKQGTANTKEGARKEGATKVVPKDKKKPVATKSKPGVVKVVKEKKDKTSSGKEESDTLAKVKKAPTKRVAEVKEAAAKSDETEKENDKTTTKPKTEAAPESTSEIGTTGTQVRSDPPAASEENAVNKAKKKRRLKPPLPSEVEVSQSDSNSEADKKTKPSLKRPKTELEAAVPSSSKDENENASPTKMQKTEPSPSAENEVGSSTDDKIESELEPLPVPETDQLMLDPPEISKWEKEEERFTDSSPDRKSKAAQKAALEKKVLPRSVIESAEKVLSQKPMRPTLASAVSTTSIKPQPAKTGRRVFLDSEGKPEERRVSKNSIQITVSSSAEKRTVTGEEDLRNKLIRDRKLSRESREQSKGSSERSHTLSSVATPVQREGRKPEKTHRALPRKESVMDESKFEPDYDERTSDSEEGNTDKETASSRGSDVSQSQSLSSDTSPAKKQKLDEESQDKDKKHKHRHSRHKKHKKHKHKHKKKKHKLEKDEKSHEKLKSSVATAR